MLKQMILVLLSFFLTEVALAERLSVMYCESNDHSEYFFTSKENIEFLEKQPAGSLADAIKTIEAASNLPPAEVNVLQEAAPVFEQLELALPSKCRQMDFSTVGYGGIHFIFSKYTVKGLQKSDNPVVVAKLPAPETNASVAGAACHTIRTVVTLLVVELLVSMIPNIRVGAPRVTAVLAGLWCLSSPKKCAYVFSRLTDY